MLVLSLVYVGVMFLSRNYNHRRGISINPFYSVSQWNPLRVELTGSCAIPQLPGTCVIEGMTGAYQDATHWCDVTSEGPCIDPDTGVNVKDNPIPFQAVCSGVPYCGWSQGMITFDGTNFVKVNVVSTGATSPPQITIQNVPITSDPTLFYMERVSVTDSLVRDQNGTLAFFYLFALGTQYTLTYTNSFTPVGTTEKITALTVQRSDNIGEFSLSIFVLAEEMPTTISTVIPSVPSAVVARKILVFGSANRQQDPTLSELQDFNGHVQQKFWDAARKYFLVMIRWNTDYSPAGAFYGLPSDTYEAILNGWSNNIFYLIEQDFVETRLGNARGRAFYAWNG